MGVKRVTKEESALMITAYENGASGKEAAALCGKDTRTFYGVLRRAGKESRGNRKYSLDEDFFGVIDSEEKAYWLGFIAADGGVYKRTLEITLKSSDVGHLRKFASAINSDCPIKGIRKDGIITKYRIRINSVKVVKDLSMLGIVPNKTFIVRPTPGISKSLLRHYWRGVVDGDGCLRIFKSHRSTGKLQARVALAGSFWIVDGFREFVLGFTNSRTKPYKNENIFQIDYCGLGLPQNIVSVLYSNVRIALDRKDDLAKQILALKKFESKYIHITKDIILSAYKDAGSWKGAARKLAIPETSLCRIRDNLMVI